MLAELEALKEITETAKFLMKSDVIEISFDSGHTWDVYVAIDDASRARGLKGVNSIDVDGMLFCFDEPTRRAFTMEGMSMDLDIATFDSEGILIEVNTYSSDYYLPITSEKEFSYVLECPAGSFSDANLIISKNG